MKVLVATLSLLALVAVTTATRADDVDCVTGSPDFVPHPTDCDKYYTCVGGEGILNECPPGLWWSPVISTCDWPENVQCTPGGSSTTVGNGTTWETTTEGNWTTWEPTTDVNWTTENWTTTTGGGNSTLPPTEPTDNSTTAETTTSGPTGAPTEPPGGLPDKCPAVDEAGVVIRLPHETNCNFYYRCRSGTTTLYSCPTGDHFSPTQRACKSQTTAGCDSCPPTDVEGDIIRLPHETLCHFYYLCEEGTPYLFQCRNEDHFSRFVRECVNPADAKCTLNDFLYY